MSLRTTMTALPRQPNVPLLTPLWQADVAQLLDEHHMIAWADSPARRTQFAVGLAQFLGLQRDTEVCVFFGKHIDSLDAFCHQLERSIPGPTLDRRIDGAAGVASLLRQRFDVRGRPATKYRYYIWHDADALLIQDHRLFGRIVDTIAGVAAESEYVSDDLLLIHRAVYIGSSVLDVYAEDARGQFQSWYDDGAGEPFWKVVTGVERPPFVRYRVDSLFEA